MSGMLTRMFASLTIGVYLLLGIVGARLVFTNSKTVTISTEYFKLFSEYKVSSPVNEIIQAPVFNFADIKFPISQKKKMASQRKVRIQAKETLIVKKVEYYDLPFNEPITIRPINFTNELNANFIALFHEYHIPLIPRIAKAEKEIIHDEVSTTQSSPQKPEPEPIFFAYAEEEEKKPQPLSEDKTVIKDNELKSLEVVDLNDIVRFDYSRAQEDIKENRVNKISMNAPVKEIKSPESVTKNTKSPKTNGPTQKIKDQAPGALKDKNNLQSPPDYSSRVSIHVVGTNLNETREESSFEIRPMDSQTESYSDHNLGLVNIDLDSPTEKMNRSVTILKRGYAPTNTDLIIEEGISETTVPMIEEKKFNELMAPYETRGIIGAVLVELDEEVETASLDVPYSKMIYLDENLIEVKEGTGIYQLFVGVKAGNTLISYKTKSGRDYSKIIHVHEHELTFDLNFFEENIDTQISLMEEDLLGKEKAPLIISGSEVQHFASNKKMLKVKNNSFKTDFGKILLGSRKYIELNHLEEPIFVGYKYKDELNIPSESFMRYVLSSFNDNNLGDKCIVQVNLSRKVAEVEIFSESVRESLNTSVQFLDNDGKFYESTSPGTEKVIILGEINSEKEYQDSKVNLKITYEDSTVDYLGSYCSPNTYLVEQL